MKKYFKQVFIAGILITFLLGSVSLVKSQDEEPITGTVIILGNDTTAPIIVSVIVSENLTSPFDQVAYDFSINTLWYSNIKSFDSVLNISVTATDDQTLKSFNTSTEWNDGENVTIEGYAPTATVQFNYTISNGETSNSNISLEVYDFSPFKATYNITSTLDNTVPDDFDISVPFTTVNYQCVPINTTVIDSQSGFNGVGIIIDGITKNFTNNGINTYCGLENGLHSIYAQAYDNVGNLKNATNSGLLFIQVDFTETATKPRNLDNWLAEMVTGEIIIFFLLIPFSVFSLLGLIAIKRLWRGFL